MAFKTIELIRALAHVGNRIEAGEVPDKKHIEMLDAARAILEQPRLGDHVRLLIPGKATCDGENFPVKIGDRFIISEMTDLGKHGVCYTLLGRPDRSIVFVAYTGHFAVDYE